MARSSIHNLLEKMDQLEALLEKEGISNGQDYFNQVGLSASERHRALDFDQSSEDDGHGHGPFSSSSNNSNSKSTKKDSGNSGGKAAGVGGARNGGSTDPVRESTGELSPYMPNSSVSDEEGGSPSAVAGTTADLATTKPISSIGLSGVSCDTVTA